MIFALLKVFVMSMVPKPSSDRQTRAQQRAAAKAADRRPDPPTDDEEEEERAPVSKKQKQAEETAAETAAERMLEKVLGRIEGRIDDRFSSLEKKIDTRAAPLKEYTEPLLNMVQDVAVEIGKAEDKGGRCSQQLLRTTFHCLHIFMESRGEARWRPAA